MGYSVASGKPVRRRHSLEHSICRKCDVNRTGFCALEGFASHYYLVIVFIYCYPPWKTTTATARFRTKHVPVLFHPSHRCSQSVWTSFLATNYPCLCPGSWQQRANPDGVRNDTQALLPGCESTIMISDYRTPPVLKSMSATVDWCGNRIFYFLPSNCCRSGSITLSG